MAAAQPCQHPRRSVLIDMGELVSDFIHYNYDDEDRNLYDSDIVALATKAKGGKGPLATSSDLDLAYVVFPVELWFELLSCQGVDILHLDLYERVVLGMNVSCNGRGP
eukprot:tig00021045_g17654.t1